MNTNTTKNTVLVENRTTKGAGNQVNVTRRTVTMNTGTETVIISGDYAINTVLSGFGAIFGTDLDQFGINNTNVVKISKGVLLYNLYKTGEFELTRYFPFNTRITQGGLLGVTMVFLPTTTRALWENVIRERVTPDMKVSRGYVLNMWKEFLTYTINVNAKVLGIVADVQETETAIDISRYVLALTLYREGEKTFTRWTPIGSNTTRVEMLNAPMEFLPRTIRNVWCETVSHAFTNENDITRNEILTTWKTFLTENIVNNTNNHVTTYAQVWPYLESNTYTVMGTNGVPIAPSMIGYYSPYETGVTVSHGTFGTENADAYGYPNTPTRSFANIKRFFNGLIK